MLFTCETKCAPPCGLFTVYYITLCVIQGSPHRRQHSVYCITMCIVNEACRCLHLAPVHQGSCSQGLRQHGWHDRKPYLMDAFQADSGQLAASPHQPPHSPPCLLHHHRWRSPLHCRLGTLPAPPVTNTSHLMAVVPGLKLVGRHSCQAGRDDRLWQVSGMLLCQGCEGSRGRHRGHAKNLMPIRRKSAL